MNQFVDLDEDGLFEVHFGKGLGGGYSSTARDATSSTALLTKRDGKRLFFVSLLLLCAKATVLPLMTFVRS
jgi:hypothetical protein